mmetsp:Transcript_2345/g.5298  ORF Transcript_2345/g.5298 Transcript_2345/m.5298 type:complete len:229 (+) Transcript_2345:1211-1897(+)
MGEVGRHVSLRFDLGLLRCSNILHLSKLLRMLPIVGNILSDAHNSYDIVLGISAGGSIDKKVSNLLRLGLELELVVRSFIAVKGLVENLLHRIPKRRYNKRRHQRLVKCFLLTKPSDLGGLVIPLIDITIHVDAKNRSIGRINQLPKFIGHCRNSSIMLSSFRHILRYANHANDVILCISTSGSIHKQVPDLIGLCPEFELVVRGAPTLQSIVKNLLDRLTKRWHNEC